MTVNYNVSGTRRKAMVQTVSEALGGWEVNYLGAPTFSYQVGDFEVTKDGTLIFADRTDAKLVESVLTALAQAGFECELMEPAAEKQPEQTTETVAAPTEEAMNAEPTVQTGIESEQTTETDAAPVEEATEPAMDEPSDNLSISLPRESFTDDALTNLDNLLESKGNLIRKSFGIEEASYTLIDDRITFDWLQGEITPEASRAFQDFIGKLCEMAKNQKRVTAKAKAVENEKYAFRCFLLRLGLIGAEYKTTRKILMQNLSGNASFKSGHRKEADGHEISGQGAD